VPIDLLASPVAGPPLTSPYCKHTHTNTANLLQAVPVEDVLRVLRKRFGTSGVDEKAARPPKILQQ
jgi:hypothetical protein